MSRERIKEAVEHLKKGQLIIVADDDNREAEGDLIGLASLATPETVNFMTINARGLICVPLSKEKAERLKLAEMSDENTDIYSTAFTISVDHKETSTGISAHDRALTIKALAMETSVASDFNRPGHIFPLIANDGGVLKRRGHTEAAIDLAKLANAEEVTYICEILNEDGTMARRPELEQLAKKWQMPMITVEELAVYLTAQQALKVKMPTEYGDFELSLFEDQDQKEHLLLSKGDIQSGEPLLVRIHSECMTGDVFGSHRCDCGEQLHKAMRMIQKEGRGAIIYLRQEGRGIGLKKKLESYRLQEKGLDTYEANVALGHRPDERHYDFAINILKSLNIRQIRLLTNNPDKMGELKEAGIEIAQRVPLEVPLHKENVNYMTTKKIKFHHQLTI
ncbi:3,4-dihydroxy-2-butanone-4-phosphate synthase [Ruoffia tabacinasalis]|uniref:3,4-dihydroxy-2-butanone-4-phosphate synthase n=1 Tax=Ruoffia tabacinasalis TaxID=87458 RepID=UPI0030CE30C7